MGSTKMYMLEGKGCQVVTVVGVISIASICMIYTYLVIMNMSSLRDPTSSSFVSDPMSVSVLVFFLCGSIAYSFMALFDHAAETLLYCYAWNKKFAKDSNGAPVSDYLPESLRGIVDEDSGGDGEGYCFYGQANPSMYLSTWLPRRKKKGDKINTQERTLTPMGSVSGRSTRDGGGATMSQLSYQGGNSNTYQAVPNGYGGQGYGNPGDYMDQGYGASSPMGNNFGSGYGGQNY